MSHVPSCVNADVGYEQATDAVDGVVVSGVMGVGRDLYSDAGRLLH